MIRAVVTHALGGGNEPRPSLLRKLRFKIRGGMLSI